MKNVGAHVMTSDTGLARMLRRYIECMIVVWCPWVLLTEMEAEEVDPCMPSGPSWPPR